MPPDIPRPAHAPGLAGAFGPERAEGLDDPTAAWEWPAKDSQWILLKADVTKAHRRIKVLPQDWRFQVAQLDNEWWVNKVGTYGVASAQLYWGRMAALLLRILYYLFPQIDWGFVFVDDLCWLLRLPIHRGAIGHTGGFGNAPYLEEDSLGRDQHLAWVRDPPNHTSSPDGGPQAHQGHGAPGGACQWIPHVSQGH